MKVNIKKHYERSEPKYDYLKYWRVIRYFYQQKYDLKQAELEILLFLYSEMYFNKTKFKEYENLFTWDRKRFNNLLDRGFIHMFRPKNNTEAALYEVTHKTRTMITTMYKKLNGEEIPEHPDNNPLFKKNVKYTDKVYKNMIKEMNKSIKQQRYLSRE